MTLFESIGVPTIETLASALEPLEVTAGETVIHAGDTGECFYVIEEGRYEARIRGHVVHVFERGEGFGELALLADVPRTADVVALAKGRLYSLGRDDFLTAVTGSPAARREADRLLRERLPPAATIAP